MATKRNQIRDVSKLAVSLAEQAAQNPAPDQDPQVVQAIEQVLGLLEQRATAGSDLSAVIAASRAAISSKVTAQETGEGS